MDKSTLIIGIVGGIVSMTVMRIYEQHKQQRELDTILEQTRQQLHSSMAKSFKESEAWMIKLRAIQDRQIDKMRQDAEETLRINLEAQRQTEETAAQITQI